MSRKMCVICGKRPATTTNVRCDACKAVELFLGGYLKSEEGRRFVKRKLRNAEDTEGKYGQAYTR